MITTVLAIRRYGSRYVALLGCGCRRALDTDQLRKTQLYVGRLLDCSSHPAQDAPVSRQEAPGALPRPEGGPEDAKGAGAAGAGSRKDRPDPGEQQKAFSMGKHCKLCGKPVLNSSKVETCQGCRTRQAASRKGDNHAA